MRSIPTIEPGTRLRLHLEGNEPMEFTTVDSGPFLGRSFGRVDGSPEPKTLTVMHVQSEEFDGDWPPQDAAGFINWFASKVEEIPAEFRDSAQIELGSVGGYEGEHSAKFEITYSRPETDAEVATRLEGYRLQVEREKAVERATFDRLKAKFGDE